MPSETEQERHVEHRIGHMEISQRPAGPGQWVSLTLVKPDHTAGSTLVFRGPPNEVERLLAEALANFRVSPFAQRGSAL